MTSVKPSQNFEPGTCPFINLHFDLKQFDGKEHECKCLALVNSQYEKSEISSKWLTYLLENGKLNCLISDFKHEQIREIILSNVELTLNVKMKDEKDTSHYFKLNLVDATKLQDVAIILGNDFLLSKEFHSLTKDHIILKNPKNHSILIKIPLQRFSTKTLIEKSSK